MKCWRCEKEIIDRSKECIYCHADQRRNTPQTEVGKAMRQLYDRYGAEAVLLNPVLLANGLGDVVSNSLEINVKKLKNQIKMGMDAGLGRLYYEQIKIGKPDSSFDKRVNILLTEDVGLNEKAAHELSAAFDEMIGWRANKTLPEDKYKNDPSNAELEQKSSKNKEMEKPPKDNKKIYITLLSAIVIIGYFLYTIINDQRQKNFLAQTQTAEVIYKTQQSVYATQTKMSEPTPTLKPTATKAPTWKPKPSFTPISIPTYTPSVYDEQLVLSKRFHSMMADGRSLQNDDFVILNFDERKYYDHDISYWNKSVRTPRGIEIGDNINLIYNAYGKPYKKYSCTEDNYPIFSYCATIDLENLRDSIRYGTSFEERTCNPKLHPAYGKLGYEYRYYDGKDVRVLYFVFDDNNKVMGIGVW